MRIYLLTFLLMVYGGHLVSDGVFLLNGSPISVHSPKGLISFDGACMEARRSRPKRKKLKELKNWVV